MEIQDAINELRSRVKPYFDADMPASTYYNTLRNIEAGLAKPATIAEFLGKFGYTVEVEFKILPPSLAVHDG